MYKIVIIIIFNFFINFVCPYVCVACAFRTFGGEKKVLGPLTTQPQTVVSYHGALGIKPIGPLLRPLLERFSRVNIFCKCHLCFISEQERPRTLLPGPYLQIAVHSLTLTHLPSSFHTLVPAQPSLSCVLLAWLLIPGI